MMKHGTAQTCQCLTFPAPARPFQVVLLRKMHQEKDFRQDASRIDPKNLETTKLVRGNNSIADA